MFGLKSKIKHDKVNSIIILDPKYILFFHNSWYVRLIFLDRCQLKKIDSTCIIFQEKMNAILDSLFLLHDHHPNHPFCRPVLSFQILPEKSHLNNHLLVAIFRRQNWNNYSITPSMIINLKVPLSPCYFFCNQFLCACVIIWNLFEF